MGAAGSANNYNVFKIKIFNFKADQGEKTNGYPAQYSSCYYDQGSHHDQVAVIL